MVSTRNELRVLDESNLDDGVALFNEMFEEQITEQRFRGKHLDNPYRASVPGLIAYLDGIPLALMGILGMRLVHNGRVYDVVQGADFAAKPKAPGSPAVKIGARLISYVPSAGYSLFLAFPAPLPFSLLSHLGFDHIQTL